MKMLVSEFLQAYDLHGAVLEKIKKASNNLELTISLSNNSMDGGEKKFLKITFMNIFELNSEIPLHKVKGNPIESMTAQQLPTVHGVTEQQITVRVEAKEGIQAINFQARRMEVEEGK